MLVRLTLLVFLSVSAAQAQPGGILVRQPLPALAADLELGPRAERLDAEPARPAGPQGRAA